MKYDFETIFASYANNPEKQEFDRAKTEAEIHKWFFETYIPHWVSVGAGKCDDGPEFVLKYWGTPMYFTGDEPPMAVWLNTDEEVVNFLAIQHQVLQASGYSHTYVPDQKIRAYNAQGGAIEVIWSRRAADETEIQRYVVHFEIAKFGDTWKVVGGHSRSTDPARDGDSIDAAWKN